MSRKEFEASRMRQLKRHAARYGLTILTADKVKQLGGPGGHQVRDENYNVLFGNVPKPFSASLEEIEEWFEQQLKADEE